MKSVLNGLAARRAEIADRWLSAIVKTYPGEDSPFLGDSDRFRNPVAHALHENVQALVDAIVLGDDWGRAIQAMKEIAQIRTVQGFDRDDARAFVEPLKTIVRDLAAAQPGDVLAELDSRVDRLASVAADLHAACRKRIDDIAAREAQRRTWLLGRLSTHARS